MIQNLFTISFYYFSKALTLSNLWDVPFMDKKGKKETKGTNTSIIGGW